MTVCLACLGSGFDRLTSIVCPLCDGQGDIPVRVAELLAHATPAQLAYNARTSRLRPTGDASRDTLVAARLNMRREA